MMSYHSILYIIKNYNKQKKLTKNKQQQIQTYMQSIIAQQKIHFYQFMQIQLLHQYIQSGIQYMIKSIINSNQRLTHLRYYTTQIVTLISALKDIYFLIQHKGIYAQNFYGLQRINPQNKKVIAMQIIIWIVLPYIWKKIDKKYNEYQTRLSQGQQITNKIIKLFIKMYPICYSIVKIISTIMKFRYLIKKGSKYYSIKYHITRTQLGYIQNQQPSPFPIMSLLKSPGLFLLLVAHKIAGFIFSNDKKNIIKDQVVQVKPPIVENKSKQCPICGKKFKNPAVLRSSGYVFCYSCIQQEIRKQRKCPVTQIPSEQGQIQIIYE